MEFTRICDDGSLVDNQGRVVQYSVERFVKEICDGDNCFFCGIPRSNSVFTDEHIVPQWILRHAGLFNKSITLPNRKRVPYGRYTVPCCSVCNGFLGRSLEQKIAPIVTKGLAAVNEYITRNGPWDFFLWLALIFLKTHLKDRQFRMSFGRETKDVRISDLYDWESLHHLHCLVRSPLTRATIRKECMGSMLVMHAHEADGNWSSYDYRDYFAAQTILLRIGDVAFIAVLDDSGAAAEFFSGHTERICGPLSPIQLREVQAHLALINLKLKHRPAYYTKYSPADGSLVMGARFTGPMELEPHSAEEFGEMLYSNVEEYVPILGKYNPDLTEENIRKGRYHFLFDHEGRFIQDSMMPREGVTMDPDDA